jgi:hypothetical protein
MAEPQYADDDNGGILYTANRPIVPDGKLPSGRNGCSTVYVSLALYIMHEYCPISTPYLLNIL